MYAKNDISIQRVKEAADQRGSYRMRTPSDRGFQRVRCSVHAGYKVLPFPAETVDMGRL